MNAGGFDDVLDGAGDGAFVIGTDGRILLWNRAAEKILGHTARETVGKACCDIFAGQDEHGNRLCYRGCHVMTLAKMGETVQSFDLRTHTKTNHAVWLNVSVLSVPAGRHGPQPVTIHLFRDVTATRELLTLVHERLTAAAPGDPAAAAADLTRREVSVLRLLAEGANTKVSAERLGVSRLTVRNHVQNILGKLGVHSRLEAVAYANRHRLI